MKLGTSNIVKHGYQHTDAAFRAGPLRFLLEKTASVRMGVKPGELLRLRHRYEIGTGSGMVSLSYADICSMLNLDYIELDNGRTGVLVLFCNRSTLSRTLSDPACRAILDEIGYPADHSPEAQLDYLAGRFADGHMAHEVGVFIGYPPKDVRAFIEQRPTVAHHGTPWRIFGDVGPSVRLAMRYSRAERFASVTLDAAPSVRSFYAFCNYASFAFK